MPTETRTGIYFVLTVLWMGVIGIVSFSRVPPGVETLNDIAHWLPFPKVAMRSLQAIIHAILFGVFAMLGAMVVVSVRPSVQAKHIVLIVLGTVVVTGIAIEILQTWVPGRTLSLTDFLGDLAGAAGVLAVSKRTCRGPFRDRAVSG